MKYVTFPINTNLLNKVRRLIEVRFEYGQIAGIVESDILGRVWSIKSKETALSFRIVTSNLSFSA